MEKSVPLVSAPARQPTVAGLPEFHLLLVSSNPTWSKAVRCATEALGGGEVLTCDARGALALLAGTASHYSHLLVDRDDAEGLLDELADLANEVGAPDTDMLVLGSADAARPHIRSVSTATSRSIAEALRNPAPRRRGPEMNLAELRAALNGAMIETRYQPIIRIADRRPVGLEALARLNHPQRGPILPDRFVPQIEDAGLAAELTALVSERAMNDLKGPFLADCNLRMSVNFPLDVLLQPAALDRLEQQRIAAGVAAGQIIIELTESRPVDNILMLRRSLERLRGLGYGAAIDDVGPAVPRLAPLLDLPFTSLKLDKDLVQRSNKSSDVRRFVVDTIGVAHARGLTVVAEGVESEAIWNQMREFGADEIQGFLAARPLPVAAVPIWRESWTAASKIAAQSRSVRSA
jgi:EAL domain-containing protein (putative c-di-GMP-specific phosphodiesterase class I)